MAEDPMEADAVIPEAPVPDPPPHVPGQVSAPAQQGAAAAVPPVGGPNDTNAHQALPETVKAGTAVNNHVQEPHPTVRPSNYKTRLCMKWQQQGECAFGARCNFAHGIDEIRSHHQNEAAHVANAHHGSRYSQNKGVNENRKTRLCTKWHQYGVCPYADKCNFAHGVHELKNPGMMHDMNGSGGPHPATVRNNYKTRICLNWQNAGQCTYAARCNFAHGVHELRGGGGKGDKGNMRGQNHHSQQQVQQQQAQQQAQSYPNGLSNYGMIGIAQMPFHPMHGGEMAAFQGPVVPMGAGGMPFGMPPNMPPPGMEHFAQPGGYMPQMHPVFSQVPPGQMMQQMMPYPTPSPGPVAPPMGSSVDPSQQQEMVAQTPPQIQPDPAQVMQQS